MCHGAAIEGTREALLAELGELDRRRSRVMQAIAEFDASMLWELDGATCMRTWLETEARMSAAGAGAFVRTARKLQSLPVMASAFADGSLSGDQVQAVLANVPQGAVEAFAAEETELIPLLAKLTVSETAAAMRHWKATRDDTLPDEPERHVHLSQSFGGVYELTGSLDAEGGAVVATALRVADDGDREKSRSERQADALVSVCQWFLDHYDADARRRNRPHVSLVVDLSSLTGKVLDGPELDSATIRTYLCDAGISRVVTDGAGKVLEYGRTQRTAPQPLYNALAVRDGGCRFPGCDRPTSTTHAHHLWEWEDGGPTDLDNMVLLCSRHHHQLHRHGWEATLDRNGTFHVTLTDGRHLTSRPPPKPGELLAA